MIPPAQREHGEFGLRVVDALVISPSQELKESPHSTPTVCRARCFLVSGVAANRHGANLVELPAVRKTYC